MNMLDKNIKTMNECKNALEKDGIMPFHVAASAAAAVVGVSHNDIKKIKGATKNGARVTHRDGLVEYAVSFMGCTVFSQVYNDAAGMVNEQKVVH